VRPREHTSPARCRNHVFPGQGTGQHARRICSILVGVALLLLATTALAQTRALVVFGSAVRPDGTPGATLTQRLRTTLKLAQKDRRAPIIVSGGTVTAAVPEGRVMKRWLVDHGVAPGRILVEPRARHTGENAELSAPLLRRVGATEATLITSRYHTRRAGLHMRWALRGAGLGHVELKTRGAPDGLGPLGRLRAFTVESAKIVRDTGLHLRQRFGGRR